MANRMVEVESEVFVGVWVYSKYLFLDLLGPFYEHII